MVRRVEETGNPDLFKDQSFPVLVVLNGISGVVASSANTLCHRPRYMRAARRWNQNKRRVCSLRSNSLGELSDGQQNP